MSQLDSRTFKVVQTIGIGTKATDLATGAGGVWVATGNDNTLVRIDPRTGAVLSTLRLPNEKTQPTTAPAVAVGEGAVWAASGFRLLKIDPATGRIVSGLRRMGCCGGLADIALGTHSVWIADLTEVVVRVSPSTGTPTGKPVRGPYPSTLAVGYGSVWVAGADQARHTSRRLAD